MRTPRPLGALLALGVLLSGTAAAQHAPYAGEQSRAVAALSSADIAAIEAGEGWGLAKPAELNGYPGPRHVLDLADALELSTAQESAVAAIRDGMAAAARRRGAAYVAAEADLDAAFADGTADPASLARRLDAAAAAKAALREVHLSAHLEVRPLLTGAQLATYDRLRGYDGSRPLSGHQPDEDPPHRPKSATGDAR